MNPLKDLQPTPNFLISLLILLPLVIGLGIFNARHAQANEEPKVAVHSEREFLEEFQ